MVIPLTLVLILLKMVKYVCLLNAPGTIHDSTMADYGVYEDIEKVYDKTGVI